MDVKNILRNKRIDLGLTMKDVAARVGVSEATISRWESGDIENMKRDKIAALAKALQISPSVIMGWDEPECTQDEIVLLEAFRKLNSKGKRRVMDAINDYLRIDEYTSKGARSSTFTA